MRNYLRLSVVLTALIALANWWGGDIPSFLLFGEIPYPEETN